VQGFFFCGMIFSGFLALIVSWWGIIKSLNLVISQRK
jgi:hypothetical protein